MKKLLIANRGEIALRVIRACRDLGITAVAVYSEPDRNALHVRYADEAYLLGPGPARESYLSIPKVLEVARACAADAIHPGYGFLAENAAFAEAVAEAGMTFIGPPPKAIRLLGDKATARRLMQEAGVPLVPGTDLVHEPGRAATLAEEIGYPILVKASAGGGGRGIREVRSAGDLEQALRIAADEALQAFGDAGVFLEKLIPAPRHVEVQVMADSHGNVVALGERECSIQRRHQKIIEEAPSPIVDPELRQRMMAAAVTAARATGYQSAGTVEFLVDQDKRFYFLEVNTRLQVEHPITELITGADLVRDQLLVAGGAPLGYRQEDIHFRGWAIECRIAAEDPANNFIPSMGQLRLFREPSGPGVRVDSGLFDYQEVSPFYDSLLAKVCVWGEDRSQAIQRMQRALQELSIAGITTNIALHRQIMADPEFQRGNLSTGFLEGFFQRQGEAQQQVEIAALAAAILAHHQGQAPARTQVRPVLAGRSPWAMSYRDYQRFRGDQRPFRNGR